MRIAMHLPREPGFRLPHNWIAKLQPLRSLPICLMLLAAVGLSTAGCKEKPSWSLTATSPDGKMIASAATYGGGVGGWTQTTVYLNWTTGSQPQTEIFAFSDGPNIPHGMDVELNWLDSTHLEIAYKGKRATDFEAIKCEGVSISSRVL
jgi:hypothetical protein